MKKLTTTEYLNILKESADFKRFSAFETFYNLIIASYPERATIELTDNSRGTFIETLITGKIKDNNPNGDIKNYDVKTYTTKTKAHYNENTSSDMKKYLNVFISKEIVIKTSDYLIKDKTSPKRASYQDNINIGVEISFNQMLELVQNLKD